MSPWKVPHSSTDVDIIFVLDNSGSMGSEQAIWATGMKEFIAKLDEREFNYRIGFTTTDNGNPLCPAGATTPEGGNFVLSSCKERLNEFVFSDTVDVQDIACNDLCTLSPAELEIQPTVADDGEFKPRKWLENIDGVTNLPVPTDLSEAIKCFGPQGVNGCGFEAPLESMYLALLRGLSPEGDSSGLLARSCESSDYFYD